MATVPDDRLNYHLTASSLKWHAARAFRYGLVGGAGLLLDFSLFMVLVQAGIGPFAANIISSGTTLTTVYFVSVKQIFRYDGHFILPLLAVYLTYHFCGTILFSWVISRLVDLGVAPPLAKIGILPVTFTMNYLFMSWLTARRQRWARPS
jgi:putative flippase GtrA